MNRKDIEIAVKEIIVDQWGVEEAKVVTDADLGKLSPGGGTSGPAGGTRLLDPDFQMDLVQLIMALEERFEIEIPENDAERLRTVRDIIDFVDANCSL